MSETKVIESPQFTLGTRDFYRALLTAVFSQIFPILWTAFEAWKTGGAFALDWRMLVFTAASAAIGHLGLNFVSKSKVVTVVGSGSTTEDTAKNIKRVV